MLNRELEMAHGNWLLGDRFCAREADLGIPRDAEFGR